MRVISVSRRTDVPAFYATWFMNRIRAGFCHWQNPFSGQIYRVSLSPEDCLAIIFWTRNPKPLLPYLAELDERGYTYYFHYTLLDYPRTLETHTPGLETALQTFQTLSDRITPERIFWRYDPILISNLTAPEFHLDRLAYLAQRLAGYTQRCIYSFVDYYGKTKRNLARLAATEDVRFETLTAGARRHLLTEMVRILQGNDMQLYACCEAADLHIAGVQPNRCVDLDVLRRLRGEPDLHLKSKPTRPLCGCVESVDIGSYDTCLFGCRYCYATNSRQVGLTRHAAHDPADTILSRPERLSGIDLETLVKKKAETLPLGI